MSLNDNIKEEILRNIALSGESEAVNVNHIISKNTSELLELSKGLPKIKYRLIQSFKLILSQPLTLKVLNPFEIRCSLCNKVISYPAWYYEIKYAVNHFHYFVCFNGTDKVNAKCYRRV